MRAVLRTLAQCHHHRILHRDIKPGNFMLLSDAGNAPLKAIGELPGEEEAEGPRPPSSNGHHHPFPLKFTAILVMIPPY